MKNKFVYVATAALMASGLLFANTIGELPASKAGEQQGSSIVICSYVLPATMGTMQLQNIGASLNGELPGTVQNGQRGSASPNSMLLPGTDSDATPLLGKQLSGL